MTAVNLEIGMTAIRRDGKRKGPVEQASGDVFPFQVCGSSYTSSGNYWNDGSESQLDIIAAGFPWAELGAQAGDMVRCVWDGDGRECPDSVFVVRPSFKGRLDSLYVITSRAAKPAPVTDPHNLAFAAGPQICGLTPLPADRPRAAKATEPEREITLLFNGVEAEIAPEDYTGNTVLFMGITYMMPQVDTTTPIIEWGQWIEGAGAQHAGPNNVTRQIQCISGKYQHRLPKPPVVEWLVSKRFGKKIKVTNTNGVITSEVLP